MTEKRHLRFKRKHSTILAPSAIAIVEPSALPDTAPEAVVRGNHERRARRHRQQPCPATLRQVAESKVVPHFDFRKMTQLAAGRVEPGDAGAADANWSANSSARWSAVIPSP